MTDFIFLGSKITVNGDCSHEIKKMLLLGRKAMIDPDSVLKSRDIILPTKVRLVKAMVFPVVMYGCESWTTKKAPEDGEGQGSQACCSPWDFSLQEYWNELPCPPPGLLPHPETKPISPALLADTLPLSHQGSRAKL